MTYHPTTQRNRSVGGAGHNRLPARTLGAAVLLAVLVTPAYGVHYVDLNATGTPEDGSSWNNAFRTITNATKVNGRELWVATGCYTSQVTTGMELGATALYGGFTNGMTSLDQRDWAAYPAVLDGGGSNRVLAKTAIGILVLDGFTVRNGFQAGTGATSNGAALVHTSSGDSPLIRNCIFSNNVTAASGGAIHLNSSKTKYSFSNCTFAANRAGGTGGAFVYTKSSITSDYVNCTFFANAAGAASKDGGAVYDDQTSELTFRNCSFSNNVSTQNGGAIRANGRLILDGCDFVENSAKTAGGALFRSGTANTNVYRNCLFAGNLASGVGSTTGGGAIIDSPTAYVILTSFISNCTFLANSSTNGSLGTGGGIRAGAAGSSTSILFVVNCIFWSNSTSSVGSDMRLGGGATVNLSYSDINTANISGGTQNPGLGNINADPLVASDTSPYDAHLKSTAGRWNPASGLWAQDAASSPCIDAGDPASDFSLEPAGNGSRINMGRYGNTLFASKSGPAGNGSGTVIFIQ